MPDVATETRDPAHDRVGGQFVLMWRDIEAISPEQLCSLLDYKLAMGRYAMVDLLESYGYPVADRETRIEVTHPLRPQERVKL